MELIGASGGTICAERTAIVKAVVRDCMVSLTHMNLNSNHRVKVRRPSPRLQLSRKFLTLPLLTTTDPSTTVLSDVNSAISPCGICRQFIREFCKLEMPILLVPADYSATAKTGEKGSVLETTMGDLLPHSFGPEQLELPRGPAV